MKFKSIKGTKDILPDESPRWQLVEETIRSVMRAFNYREIRTPLFEETALFARGIGELTDIVGKEMYTFTDRSETSLTLKPEMTASVIRAYLQHHLGEAQPLVKVYYLSPMFRQERPQAGRLRQFHQFGAEAIGGQSALIDAECIALAVAVYERLGLANYAVKINSVGCEQCRPAYRELLTAYLENLRGRLSAESQARISQNPLRVLDSKDEQDRERTANAPLMKDHLCQECAGHFTELQNGLALLGIAYTVDGRIVRGLDYYTKTAFEIITADLGSQDALAGGGRYDLLAEELGGTRTPAVGFAAGMERLLMVMEKQGIGAAHATGPEVYIAAADQAGRQWALQQAASLRRAGISCDVDLLERSLKAQMREADRQKASLVIVVGERELERQQVTVKTMSSGTQAEIASGDLVNELRTMLQAHEKGKAR